MMAEQKEPIIISVSDPGGIERDYVQDVVIPVSYTHLTLPTKLEV